ncbi:MAG: LysM peptidoglycan-binding domain-containing protein [Hyphomicrobiales bacterium]|nr:LysM peptidoglycan-binding domain-containing protein [Hyphomicrobiales bacterium]
MPLDRTAQKLPANVDPIITSSSSKKSSKSSRININNIITKNNDDQDPYPGNYTVTVKTGDTLFAISRRTGISVHKLAALNAIKTPYVIRPGQILVLGESQ